MAVLLTAHTGERRRRYVVADRCILGREEDCDVFDVFQGMPHVNGRHALITRRGDAYLLEDLGSRTGTWVNGRLIRKRVALSERDRIRIGDAEFAFQAEGGAPRTSLFRRAPAASPPATDDSEVLSSVRVPSREETRGEAPEVAPARKLRALLDLLGGLGRSIELAEALDNLLDGLFRIFPQAERGFVGVRNPETEDIDVRAIKRRDPAAPEGRMVSRTIMRRAMERREALLSLDALADPRFERSESVTLMNLRSVMCAPLMDVSGEAVGVLQLDAFNPMKGFEPEDLEVFASVAPQAAMALRYAQLHAEALERTTLDRDLDLARRVQRALLPERTPHVEGYSLHALYDAAYQVGGDYYDYVPLPDGRWAVVIADAFGKGVSASLLIAKLSGELRTYLATTPSGAAALRLMGASLDAMSDELPCRFVTLVLVLVDPQSPHVEILNAGHPLPLLRRADGTVVSIGHDDRGSALGMFPDEPYQPIAVELAPGDTLALYTDGFTEATDAAGRLYGEERLVTCLTHHAADVEARCQQIRADVQAFVAGERQSDDMCLICLDRSPKD